MKRPFMGMGIALAAGVAAGWFLLPWHVMCMGVFLTLALGMAGYRKKYWTDRTCKYVAGLSVLFIVGFCRGMLCNGEEMTTSAAILPSEILGTVEKVQEKEKVAYVFVRTKDKKRVLVVVKKEDRPETGFYKGQAYRICGTSEYFESASNPGQFDESVYYRSLHVDYRMWAQTMKFYSDENGLHRCLRWIEEVRRSMQQFYGNHMGREGNGILQASVLGERSALDADLKRYYQENGWMHLITTSGLHLSFIAMNMYKRMRKLTFPILGSTVIAFALMLGYGYMTDYGDSMLRAMGMMVLALIAKIAGRRTDGFTSLSILGACLLFLWPGRIESAGFWLTFAAVGGMEWGKRMIRVFGFFEKSSWKQRFLENFCIQLGIFVVTLPVLLWTMYEIPVFGFLYNFFMIPLISWIVPIAFFAGLVGGLNIPVFQWAAVGILHVIDGILKIVHGLPSRAFILGRPALWQMVFFCAGFAAAVWVMEKGYRWRGCTVLLISCCLLMFLRLRSNEVVFADVGQGDGICMFTKEGQTFLVDGGSSTVSDVYTYRLEPLLRFYGVDTIDGWFLSHGDQDHISGILEALETDVSIGTIFLPDCSQDAALEEIRMLAQQKGIFVQTIRSGDCVRTERMEMQCLHPASSVRFSDKNNQSMVLLVTYYSKDGPCRLLLTGDMEAEGEAAFLEQTGAMDVDLLKVAHHGSSGGTGKSFLEWTKPEWGIISCGKKNRYGHPHAQTLERLDDAGCKWLSTASQGAIFVRITSDGYRVYSDQKQD